MLRLGSKAQNIQMVPCQVLVSHKRYGAYVLICGKFEPFGPFGRFELYMSVKGFCSAFSVPGSSEQCFHLPASVEC